VYFWRQTDGRRVWYEWCLEGYYILRERVSEGLEDPAMDQSIRFKYGMTEIHNIGGKGSNMIIT